MHTPPQLSHIQCSQSDLLLRSRGFNLTEEYAEIISRINAGSRTVLELATGTGRMSAVLSLFFPAVITGDISLCDHHRAVQRVPPECRKRISYLQLNMELLPFADDSIPFLICLNTLHETEHPAPCLREMIRVVSPEGILAVGDFNRTGFDEMQKIHEQVYHNNHSEGTISGEEISTALAEAFSSVTEISTPLNRTFIARNKTVR
ncbi:MAG: class I SAM-dependent methyltransferase [Bacteroidetes bacterium]|nr:class I SAM-dependent methyltransferase [Bacteroidota bacterium]